MSVFPGTYVPTGTASTARFNHLIDDLLTPSIMSFRQIHIHDEPCELVPGTPTTWKVTWGNWNAAAPIEVRKNDVMFDPASLTHVNRIQGTFRAGAVDKDGSGRARDVVEATYIFDYFWPAILEGFLVASLSQMNMQAVGPPTSYTIETMPTNWEGVLVDLAFARCMMKLLLDYDLWRYRLLFAIGPADLESGGGGDIASQLETLKNNAETRAETAMQNEKFKTGNYLSPPTVYYWMGIRGVGGAGSLHGYGGGRLRGWKPNKYV